ncbi:hypothetical protein F2Q70_00004179 [Brassica cretica]|uniref:Uncharacterized protein n=1 Tax=Brassica cretica TaxID=69181 RepID=A0A8S9IR84_BRACR|nr:hypothetical protein F2Q70_00004179 [Brassica cretica]
MGGASASTSAYSAAKNHPDETIKRSDLEALIKALKENSEAEKDIEVTHPDHEGGNGTGTGTDENQTGAQTDAEENTVARDQDELPSVGSETEAQVGEPRNGVEPDQIQPIRNVLEISDDFGAFWRYLEQAPEMTIEIDYQSILES